MTKKQERFRLIDFFKGKSVKKNASANQRVQGEMANAVTRDNVDSLNSMILSGNRQGNFYAHDMITVTADSHISGTIVTTNGIMKGKITGNITCAGELLIEPTAIIEGNITAKIIDIRPGSVIHGTFTHFSAIDTMQGQSHRAPFPLPEVFPQVHVEATSGKRSQPVPLDEQPTGWW